MWVDLSCVCLGGFCGITTPRLDHEVLQFPGTAAWRLSHPHISPGSLLLHCPLLRNQGTSSCCEAAAQQSGVWVMTKAATAATLSPWGTKTRLTVVSQCTCLSHTQSETGLYGTFWHKSTSTCSASGWGGVVQADARWQIQPRETTAKATQGVISQQKDSSCELCLFPHFCRDLGL